MVVVLLLPLREEYHSSRVSTGTYYHGFADPGGFGFREEGVSFLGFVASAPAMQVVDSLRQSTWVRISEGTRRTGAIRSQHDIRSHPTEAGRDDPTPYGPSRRVYQTKNTIPWSLATGPRALAYGILVPYSAIPYIS